MYVMYLQTIVLFIIVITKNTNKYGNCVNINLGSHLVWFYTVILLESFTCFLLPVTFLFYYYLGHTVNNSLSDDEDMKSKEHSLYGRSNMLTTNFTSVQILVKCKLFMSYCSHVYLCFLWSSFKKALWKSITVVINAFCIILKLNRRCSDYHVFQ